MYNIPCKYETNLFTIATEISHSNCTNGEVKLVGHGDANQGRIEICINHVWGTVCDDGWDELDASVVCKQLGYQSFGKECHNATLIFISL